MTTIHSLVQTFGLTTWLIDFYYPLVTTKPRNHYLQLWILSINSKDYFTQRRNKWNNSFLVPSGKVEYLNNKFRGSNKWTKRNKALGYFPLFKELCTTKIVSDVLPALEDFRDRFVRDFLVTQCSVCLSVCMTNSGTGNSTGSAVKSYHLEEYM